MSSIPLLTPVSPIQTEDPFLDVLRNFLGGDLSLSRVRLLSQKQRQALNDLIEQTEKNWRPPAPGVDEFRAFVNAPLGGLISTPSQSEAEQTLVATLLYSNRVAVPSPLTGSPLADSWQAGLETLVVSAPLIDCGALIVVPRKYEVPAENDMAWDWDEVIAALIDDNAYWHFAQDKPGHPDGDFYATLTAEMETEKYWDAAAARARVIPENAYSREDFAHRLRIAAGDLARYDVGLTAVTALATAVLPRMVRPSVKELAAVRRSADAFEDWRSTMNNATRLIGAMVDSPDFAQEARDVLNDTVVAEATRVRRAAKRSKLFVGSAQDEALQLTLGGALLTGASIELGASPFTALAGLGIGALTRLVLKTLRPPRNPGAGSILARFEFKQPTQ